MKSISNRNRLKHHTAFETIKANQNVPDFRLDETQVKKSVILLVGFVLMRLLVARLWEHWFEMGYRLSFPFLLFLISIFLLMSLGWVGFGFSRWVGIDLKSWWLVPGRIKGDICWAVGTILLGGLVILAIGGAMLFFGVQPSMLNPDQQSDLPLDQMLAQIPIDLVLGWFFGFAVASFQEETIFRGFLQSELGRRYGYGAAVIFQALIFSLAHLGMTPIVSLGDELFRLLFRFVSGLIFGWLRMKRGTLLAAGIVHGFIG